MADNASSITNLNGRYYKRVSQRASAKVTEVSTSASFTRAARSDVVSMVPPVSAAAAARGDDALMSLRGSHKIQT